MSQGSGNYNIFTVDWGRGAIADYITASYRVKPVGLVLAKFLDFLHREAGMRFEDLQLIGFSMAMWPVWPPSTCRRDVCV